MTDTTTALMEQADRQEPPVRVKPEPGLIIEGDPNRPAGKPPDSLTKSPEEVAEMANSSNSAAEDKEEEGIEEEEPIDIESMKGIFGWETVDNTSIPYILRRGKKFVSVRIVERKLLSKYPNTFPDELGKKDPLVSHFITEAESKLLNEINTDHCDYEYGHNAFTTKDLIVDFDEFGDFFKIVKKTFPAEVLAKMSGEVNQANTTPPVVKSEVSQFCGWVQINNTVTPYILRSENGKQIQLVPLSVIVHAARLLNNTGVEGLLPTPQECAMLNEACKLAGFNFSFAKTTRLISIAEVSHRCQVKILELPFKNPLQHARYIPPMTSTGPQASQVPPPAASPHACPPHPHSSAVELAASAQLDSNPFMPQFVRHPAFPPHLMLPAQASQASAMFPPAGPMASLNMDALRAMAPRPQIPPDSKVIDMNLQPLPHMPSPLWGNMMPRAPPPAHAKSNASIVKTPPMTPESPSSLYHGQGVPQNNTFPSKSTLNMSDFAHPMFRGPMGMPPRATPGQPGHMVRYPPPATGLPPPPQYSAASSISFGVNHFSSSLFAQSDPKVPSGEPRSAQLRRLSGESTKTSNNSSNTKVRRQSHELSGQGEHTGVGNNNLSKHELKQRIMACLVNGKSISCLHIDTPTRKGRFCLVEAVSKLYFPAVPLQEFVKVLQVILKVSLLECTPDEEAAFVQYYNLPVSKLKCNKIIAVDDLDKFFPQLNYMFSKGLPPDINSSYAHRPQANAQLPSAHGVKRNQNSSDSGPPAKQTTHQKMESLTQKLHQQGEPSRPVGASVIIIDD